jgi:hypothetical protein
MASLTAPVKMGRRKAIAVIAGAVAATVTTALVPNTATGQQAKTAAFIRPAGMTVTNRVVCAQEMEVRVKTRDYEARVTTVPGRWGQAASVVISNLYPSGSVFTQLQEFSFDEPRPGKVIHIGHNQRKLFSDEQWAAIHATAASITASARALTEVACARPGVQTNVEFRLPDNDPQVSQLAESLVRMRQMTRPPVRISGAMPQN